MEFKISVDDLQTIFTKMSSVVKPSEDDMRSMLKIEVEPDGVKFRASNNLVDLLITSTNCEIIESGKVLLKLEKIKGYVFKFMPLVDNYGTENFHFVSNGEEVFLKTKTYFQSDKPSYRKLKIKNYGGKFSRPEPKPFTDTDLIVNSSIFKKGLAKVLNYVNPGEVRKSLTGVNIIIKHDAIVFAGTNGVKLAEVELAINADVQESSYVFAYNFASVLRSVLDDDAQVFIKFAGRDVYIKSNDLFLVGSLILGEVYPDYKPMFNLEKVITVPRVSFFDTVHTVMDVLNPEDNNRLSLLFKGNELFLKNDVIETSQNFDEPFGEELNIDINGEFLDSILTDFYSENLEIHFTPGVNYIVFKAPDDHKHTALLTIVKRR
jgi:DNA polymerase III sliding clamp (beta) subunit (PCNA family)